MTIKIKPWLSDEVRSYQASCDELETLYTEKRDELRSKFQRTVGDLLPVTIQGRLFFYLPSQTGSAG